MWASVGVNTFPGFHANMSGSSYLAISDCDLFLLHLGLNFSTLIHACCVGVCNLKLMGVAIVKKKDQSSRHVNKPHDMSLVRALRLLPPGMLRPSSTPCLCTKYIHGLSTVSVSHASWISLLLRMIIVVGCMYWKGIKVIFEIVHSL